MNALMGATTGCLQDLKVKNKTPENGKVDAEKDCTMLTERTLIISIDNKMIDILSQVFLYF